METVKMFTIRGVTMLGNPQTGHLIGLEPHEIPLAKAFVAGELTAEEVAERHPELGAQLKVGSYGRELMETVESAYLHVTHRCNLACEGCYSHERDRNAMPDPSLDQLTNALRFLSRVGVEALNISGGEPFLRDDLPAILEIASIECGIAQVNVLTNGTCATDAVLEACAPFIHKLSVSFDGASSEDMAYIRGAQRFDHLVDFVQRSQRAGIAVCMTPTLHSRNLADMPRYIKLAEKLGIEVGFSLLSPTAQEAGSNRLFLTEEDARALGDATAKGVEGDVREAASSLVGSLRCRLGCEAGSKVLSVAADGAVYPCHMMHADDYCLGNAFEEPYAGDVPLVCVGELGSLSEDCAACEFLPICGGGCKARAMGVGARRDPYCALYKTYFGHAISGIV